MKHGAWDMVISGDKRFEFRKDTPYHRKRLIHRTHLRLFRGGSCWNTLPHFDIAITKILMLPCTYSQHIIYPNLFETTLTGPLLAIQLGEIDNVVIQTPFKPYRNIKKN